MSTELPLDPFLQISLRLLLHLLQRHRQAGDLEHRHGEHRPGIHFFLL